MSIGLQLNKSSIKQFVTTVLLSFLWCQFGYGDDAEKLKIFILAGQSNMEGKGSIETMKLQLGVPEKRDRFVRYIENGDLAIRNDVWIDYLGNHGRRHGKLTAGYGVSKKESFERFGPELGFGWAIGDHFDEPVLIIKTAWGGKSLDRDFRPPSRGIPDSAQTQYANTKKNNPALTLEKYNQGYGHYYRLMMDEIKLVTGDLKTYVPDYVNQGYEICGFVWFQGWNDQYAPTSIPDYEDNMAAFINDVRKQLNTPQLPFVIGAMGHNGENQTGKIKQIADAQMATANRPEFVGNVVTVHTAKYWDREAEAAYERFWANKEKRDAEKWRQFGNDRGYHYFGSPKFFSDTGLAFADAMLQLIGQEKSETGAKTQSASTPHKTSTGHNSFGEN